MATSMKLLSVLGIFSFFVFLFSCPFCHAAPAETNDEVKQLQNPTQTSRDNSEEESDSSPSFLLRKIREVDSAENLIETSTVQDPEIREVDSAENLLEVPNENSTASSNETLEDVKSIDIQTWPNPIVIYTIDTNFAAGELNLINGAMKEISEKTCVKFTAQTNESAYVQFIRRAPNSGCKSALGYIERVQDIDLEAPTNSSKNCFVYGAVLHEILHTLGFPHEHARTDRDEFVTVNKGNVVPGDFESDFQKLEAKSFPGYEIGYDYNSIMHYGSHASAVNESIPTIVAKQPNVTVGQRAQLSEKDVQKINSIYSKDHPKCYELTLESKMRAMIQILNETNKQKMDELESKLQKSANSYATISQARLYAGANFSGVAEDYNVEPTLYNAGCYNLQNISANVSSIQTFDSCVRVYENLDCIGSMRVFLPGYNEQIEILGVSVVSIGPCFEVPHFGESIKTLKESIDAIMANSPKARLYSELKRTGEVEEYNADNQIELHCQNLTILAGRVKSIDNLGRCVRLFSHPGCRGSVYTVSPQTSISEKDNLQSVYSGSFSSVGPCWENPYKPESEQRFQNKVRTSLFNLIFKP